LIIAIVFGSVLTKIHALLTNWDAHSTKSSVLNRDSERIPRRLRRVGFHFIHCDLFVIWYLAIEICQLLAFHGVFSI
jgi:hypothetical protein